MNKTFRKIVGGALAVTALMGLAACGSKTEDDKAEGKTYKVGIVHQSSQHPAACPPSFQAPC